MIQEKLDNFKKRIEEQLLNLDYEKALELCGEIHDFEGKTGRPVPESIDSLWSNLTSKILEHEASQKVNQ